jgi:drug/metabolite transporter (DMT)-like permease
MLVVGPPELTVSNVGSIAYLGIGASALAFGLWNRALRYIDASVAASFINLVPVIGVSLALVWLGERLTPLQIAGGVIVGAGVIVSSK